ncbi:MAG: PTPDL family protein, partial [Prosthecobacter sp.]
AKEVDGSIAKLQAEKTMVSNGQVKLEGKWLTVKESKAESFNVEAFRIISAMREKAAKQDYPGALREFDRLITPRPAYMGSTYFVQAIPEAIEIINKWIAVLDKMSSDQPQLAQARKDGLTKLQEPELSKTKAAIADEYSKWRAMSEAEKRQKIRWTAPYKYEAQTIQYAQKDAVGEVTRLQGYNLEALKAQNDVFTACYRKIGEGDYTAGAAAFERVSALNLPMEFREVSVDLRQRMMKLYGQLVKANATGASATSGSSAIGGTNTTGVDSRVAQILAEAGAGPAAATASSGQPAAGTMAPAARPATAPAPAPAAVVAPAQAAPAPVARPAVAPAPQQTYVAPAPVAMPPPAPVEEESSLQLYIIIGMALVIVGLAVAFLKQKKKAE